MGIQEFTGECWIRSSETGTRKRTLCKFLKIVGALLPTKFCFDLCKINGTETGRAARTALAIKERDIIVLVVLAVRGFNATEIGAGRGTVNVAVVSSWTCFARGTWVGVLILEESSWALGTCMASDWIEFSLVTVGDDWNGEREREEEEKQNGSGKIS